jgi:hypothetical protein
MRHVISSRSAVTAWTVLLALLVAGCGSTPIFRANFDSDAVGGLPNENPPGAPTGDLIWTAAGSLPGVVTVVNSGELSTRNLRYANVDVPLYNRYLGFFSTEVTLAPDKSFFAYWNGHIVDDPSGSALDIWLGDGHFAVIALLRFKNGTISVRTGTNEFEQVGNYVSGTDHFILLRVDKSSAQYRLSFVPARGQSFAVGPRSVLSSSALNTSRPTLYAFYSEDRSGSGKYFFDNITISEKEPSM